MPMNQRTLVEEYAFPHWSLRNIDRWPLKFSDPRNLKKFVLLQYPKVSINLFQQQRKIQAKHAMRVSWDMWVLDVPIDDPSHYACVSSREMSLLAIKLLSYRNEHALYVN